MTAHPAGGTNGRIGTLDAVRGVAVMGILLANLPAFALPGPGYFSPLAWGGTGPADIAAWLVNFTFVEGRMRGLFSFLFGASMLLIIDRARGRGEPALPTHLRRMAVLFAFGIAHLYLLWWGDILAHYALVGMAAYLFTGLGTRGLIAMGCVTLAGSFAINLGAYLALLDSASRDTPAAIATWNGFAHSFGVPPRDAMVREIIALRGDWPANVAWRWAHATDPFGFVQIIGLQTLAAMLFGMAAYRSGLLTGAWERGRLLRWAAIGIVVSVAGYAALGLATIESGFDQRSVYFGSILASEPLRLIGVAGYAALVVLLTRDGGWLSDRVSAVGRAAFSNYLGTSIVVTGIFYGWGLGLFGAVPRAQIYLIAPIVWAIMLLWSKPWLDRFHYGPLEWLWRSLARGRIERLRRADA